MCLLALSSSSNVRAPIGAIGPKGLMRNWMQLHISAQSPMQYVSMCTLSMVQRAQYIEMHVLCSKLNLLRGRLGRDAQPCPKPSPITSLHRPDPPIYSMQHRKTERCMGTRLYAHVHNRTERCVGTKLYAHVHNCPVFFGRK